MRDGDAFRPTELTRGPWDPNAQHGGAPSPLERTMAAADFGNGISSAVRWDQFTFVNPELTVFLLREADGEWIGNDAATAIAPAGIGLADATLHDAHGPFARALQSLYVASRA